MQNKLTKQIKTSKHTTEQLTAQTVPIPCPKDSTYNSYETTKTKTEFKSQKQNTLDGSKITQNHTQKNMYVQTCNPMSKTHSLRKQKEQTTSLKHRNTTGQSKTHLQHRLNPFTPFKKFYFKKIGPIKIWYPGVCLVTR